MAVQTRTIRRRIKSVTNTRKITKAMELVAASKMRKSVSAVLSSRAYAKLAWETVLTIAQRVDTSKHPLLAQPMQVQSVLLVLFSSDRGLAGGFNVNIIRKALETIRELDGNVNVQSVCIGRRGADAMRRAGKPVIASFQDVSNHPTFEGVLPVGRLAIDEFTKGTYQKVYVVYTDYVSAITQRPEALQLLPLPSVESLRPLGEVGTGTSAQAPVASGTEYVFEPAAGDVLDGLLPMLIKTMLYQALLESTASEHSARMMAMRSASDAAKDMIGSLTFSFNQARQASITQEIAEISGGKAALEG